jgi:DNA-binding transcriptional regulator YbjK
LVEAAAALVLQRGLGALTHRAVASRAHLPLASTTYYFASVEELRDEALRHLNDGWVSRAAAVLDGLPPHLTKDEAVHAVIDVVAGGTPREQLLPQYERYLEAARHARLRPLVIDLNARFIELVQEILRRAALPAEPDDARLVLAVADGSVVTALAEGGPTGSAATATLARLVARL